MRDSNYKSISSNRAALTITTSLYDRRALDATSDKPLVNSLNYLTYLVSSSAKVRETISVDGGIERLIEILHECHKCPKYVNENGDKQVLTAWKWTLAFQCLVLIGTRGTEKIREKVARTGMLQVIATVLDNYLTLHEQVFLHTTTQPSSSQQLQQRSELQPSTAVDPNQFPQQQIPRHLQVNQEEQDGTAINRFDLPDITNGNDLPNTTFVPVPDTLYFDQFSTTAAALESTSATTYPINSLVSAGVTLDNIRHEDVENSSLENLFQLLRVSPSEDHKHGNDGSEKNNDFPNSMSIYSEVKRNFVVLNIVNRLRETKEASIFEEGYVDDCEFDMDSNLQFLSDLYTREMNINSNKAPKAPIRSFTSTGIVIPKDDDIVWSLQLLAYVSKYPQLKMFLQNAHLIMDMSIRDKQLKMYLENQIRLKVQKSLSLKSRPIIRPRSRKPRVTYVKKFNPSASNSPQMLNSLNDDNLILKDDKFTLCDAEYDESQDFCRVDLDGSANGEVVEENEDAEEDNGYDANDNSDDDDSDGDFSDSSQGTFKDIDEQGKLMADLYDRIVACESMDNNFLRKVKLHQLNAKLTRLIDEENKKLSNTIIEQRLKEKEYLQHKWNYENYQYFDIDEFDKDKGEPDTEYKAVNLFALVEKFTFLSGTDMYYWSGVIMRNSCRRNDSKGGVRQCGNLECGKWEKYPREFSKCRRCKRTKYCSKDCQMKAWHCHRNWCIPSSSSSSTSNQTTSSVPAQQQQQDQHDQEESMATPGPNNAMADDPGVQANNTQTSGTEVAHEEGQESPPQELL